MAGSEPQSALPLVREAFPRTIRLVASARLREAVLAPLADDSDELVLLAEIEGATSGRLVAEERGLGAGPHPVVASAARELLNKSDNERSGVLSTAMSFLGLYRDPVIAKVTSQSDWRIADLVSGRPTSLYLVVPPSDISRTKPLTQAFMDGIKQVLVFSDAGGTGRSYHADLAAKNQARRVHFLLEPGWRADAAIQGLGRTNRTNQASAPLFRPVTTDVRGERRFISTIARRLDSLGALTRGQRQTGGQNLFDPADNLESAYAKEALHRWFGLLFIGKLEAVTLARFEELTGLRIEGSDGSMVDDLPSIQRWLNRILALPIGLQNGIFDEFLGLVEARIDAARQAGTLDLGVETIAVEHFDMLSDTLLRTDALSGATTHLLELEIARALKPLRLERLEELYGFSGERQQFLRNARSGRIGLLVPARSLLADDGTRVARFELVRPLKHGHLTAEQLEESNWEPVDPAEFHRLWQVEVDEAAASHKRERLHLATGLLLPVWDKLPSDYVRVSRISARDGRSLLGREVPLHCVPELCQALGLENEHAFSAEQIGDTVLAAGRPMQVKGREALTLKRSLVNGAQRLELAGWSAARLDWYKAQGCFTEIIRYQTRLFVPTASAAVVLARLAGRTKQVLPNDSIYAI